MTTTARRMWHISLPLVAIAALFAVLAFKSALDSEAGWALRIGGAFLFGIAFVLVVGMAWRVRYRWPARRPVA